MTRRIEMRRDGAAPAELAWQVATDLGHLRTVTERDLTFRDLPSGRIRKGQVVDAQVSPPDASPFQLYRAQAVQSDEGVAVKGSTRSLHVVPIKAGAEIREAIAIDSGAATLFVAPWARFVSRHRHLRNAKILAPRAGMGEIG